MARDGDFGVADALAGGVRRGCVVVVDALFVRRRRWWSCGIDDCAGVACERRSVVARRNGVCSRVAAGGELQGEEWGCYLFGELLYLGTLRLGGGRCSLGGG